MDRAFTPISTAAAAAAAGPAGPAAADDVVDGVEGVDRRVYRTELLRADVAAVVGIDLGAVSGGDAVTWTLSIDAVTVACTDEPLTDTAAVAWARRMLGEGVRFLPARRDGGGYWVAGPTEDCAEDCAEHPRPARRVVRIVEGVRR